jgi:RNA polymerase sigma factor (sigma-70 family)
VAQLFSAHHTPLVRYLTRLTGDPDRAADAAQETFVRLIERPPAGPVERAWLYTVATNLVRDGGRTQARRARLLHAVPDRAPLGDASAASDDAHATVEREERRRAVSAALAALSEKERTALLMREEGFAHREIAEAVGTTTGSVGTLLVRALAKLAATLPLDQEAL